MDNLPENLKIVRAKDLMRFYGYSRNKSYDLIKKCKDIFGIKHKEAFVPFDVWLDFIYSRFPENSK